MVSLLDIAVVALGWLMVGSYVWSTRSHFEADAFPLGAKLVSIAAIGSASALSWTLLTTEQPLAWLVAGLLLQLAGAGLFWWAIAVSRAARLRFVFDAERPASILTDGPYRLVRHPFYTSYLLFWTGWAVASASPWAAAIVAYFAFAYTVAARAEEQNFAASPLSADYARYRAATGRFWPRLAR